MIVRRFRDAAQLNNQRRSRRPAFVGYLAGLAAATALVNEYAREHLPSQVDSVFLVLFLVGGVVALGRASVQLERGHLTLSGLAIGPAIILLNPIDATIAGLSLGIVTGPSSRRILTNSIVSGAYTAVGAAMRIYWFGTGPLPFGARTLVLVAVELTTLVLLAVGIASYRGETIASVVRHNFTSSFIAAYGYFTVGSLLITYVLDGSLLGYLLAAIVWVLALALTDTIAGRRVRRVLESELSDADRHLFHSRAVEGVVHNLRNHVATAVGYLKEIDLKRLDPVDREAVETATAAANDAAAVLRGLAQGATPRVTFAPKPVDLNELATTSVGMARPRAKAKQIELGLRGSPDEVTVEADPLLLREVMTNLVNNAIDAAPIGGHVNVSTGRRGSGSTFFSVADDGPGVADENRHRLFEPHFTTKETGTGIGLFMSYGVVREHHGQLLYEGSRRGGVFTVVLPQFAG